MIRRARELAARLGVASAVMTFHPHPREVLGKSKLSGYITPLPDKLRQFARLGVDRTYVMKFDRLFADRTKEQFVEEVLIPLQVKGVVVGFNFCFGRGASGRAEDLKTLGEGRFCVEVIHPVLEGEIPVSSTRLREALAAGDVVTAEKILGRPYLVEGEVVTGDRRGRTIGFPTANLALTQPYAIPKRGVYLVSVALGDRWIPGVMNIGLRPTFQSPNRSSLWRSTCSALRATCTARPCAFVFTAFSGKRGVLAPRTIWSVRFGKMFAGRRRFGRKLNPA